MHVIINVKPHKYFEREGDNIDITIPISAIDATLGCQVDVPTVYGDVTMTIPEGTQPGSVLRLRGKGVKNWRNNSIAGDQYVTIDVKIPKKVSKKERDLYKQLQDSAKKNSIFDQFKRAFKN